MTTFPYVGLVSIVVPLHNEEDNVVPLVREIRNALHCVRHEIILIDDASTDQTVARVPQEEGIHLIQFRENSGQSAAMIAGVEAATGDVIVFMDGDLQNDPADIPRMLVGISAGADLVCGSRRIRKDTFVRRLSSKVANFVRSSFLGDGVKDTGCTLKAMHPRCRPALIPFRGMHRFIPALIKGAGFKVSEIPVNHRPRGAGTSKYGLSNRLIQATLDMLGVWWLLRRRLAFEPKSTHHALVTEANSGQTATDSDTSGTARDKA